MKMLNLPPLEELAVLVSGGADSAVLLGEALESVKVVHPLFLRCGLYWEPTELEHLRQFLVAIRCPALRPLHILDMPVADVYPDHWSVSGQDVPDADSPDEAVFLPGRNVWLLSKAIVWCHLHGVPAVALGTLAANPFPDATAAFIGAFQNVVNQAVGGSVRVYRPYTGLTKKEVLRRGRNLPLELTFSCLRPVAGQHCGRCNKCGERRRGFAEAGVIDRTPYAGE
jgi:7-cyano-7-deazaguanine synthase